MHSATRLGGKTAGQFCEIQARDGGIGDDQQIPAANVEVQQLPIRQQSRADRDGIA